MFGPTIKATFDRGRGEGEIELELGPFKDEGEGIRKFVEWFADNRVRQYLSIKYPVTLSGESDWLKRVSSDDKCVIWLIYANGTLIGNVGIMGIDRSNNKAELGIVIGDQNYWGKGIAAVAEMLAADFVFSNIVAGGLNKIIARVKEGNDASRKALEKVGFREVGIFRKDCWNNGRWHDMWMSELLQEDWKKTRDERLASAGVTKFEIYPGSE